MMVQHTNRRRYFIRNTMSVMRTNRRQCRCCFRHHHNHRERVGKRERESTEKRHKVQVSQNERERESLKTDRKRKNDFMGKLCVPQKIFVQPLLNELQLKNEIDMNNIFIWILALMYRRVFLIMRIAGALFLTLLPPPRMCALQPLYLHIGSFSISLSLSVLFWSRCVFVPPFIIYTRHAIEICHEIKGCTHCIHT